MDTIDHIIYAKKNKFKSWIEIRIEYETTDISYRKLSKKYKKNFSTLQKRAKRENWYKNLHKIETNVRQKTIEKITDNIAETQASHYNISEKFLNVINKAFENEKEFNTFVDKIKSGDETGFYEEITEITLKSINDKKILNMVNAFEKIQKAQRQTLGINDKKDTIAAELKEKEFEHRKEMDKKRLELEEKKYTTDSTDEDNKRAIKEFIEATKADEEELDELFEEELANDNKTEEE